MASKSGKGKEQREQGKQTAKAVDHGSELALVCRVYIGLAAALSCGLNAVANVRMM
jgi:hypothetical protein